MSEVSDIGPQGPRPSPVVAGLAGLLTIAAVVQAADLPSRLGYSYYTEQFLALVLGLSLALVFLMPRRDWDQPGGIAAPRLIDWALSGLGLILGLYIMVFYPSLVGRAMSLPWDALIVGGAMFLLVLEGLRRTVGWTLVIVVLVIVGYGLIGHLVPGALQTREVAAPRMAVYLAFDPNGVLGLTLGVAATVVVAFVFFGQLLLRSGGADFFNDIAMASMGHRRGGAAKISIVASGLFGSISGVVVSNIVATGVVTIRLMIQSGFRRTTAAAVEAVASTGGQIAPPVMGAVAFLMADILQRPYSEIVVAAIVPALLYYVALFVQADLQAAKQNIVPLDTSDMPATGPVLRRGWVFILPFAAIIIALFWMNQRAETAALWGGAGALFIGLFLGYGKTRMALRDLWDAAVETGRSITEIIMISAAAGFIIGVLNVTGLGFAATFALVDLGQGSLFLLLLISALVCLVLGMGMPTVGVYLLLAVLIAPSLVETGVEPIAAHLFIFYLGMMSMVTPPIGIGAFFAASIAKAGPMSTAWEAMRFGWTAYIVPFLFVFSPALLLIGEPGDIALAVSTAVIGVYAVSAAFVGWLRGPIATPLRLATGAAGVALMLPPGVGGAHTLWINGAGFLLLAALWLMAGTRPSPAAAPVSDT
ncbi:MAG: TRAP transporter fused permease subunit [Pseudomonadota bacterium]|uniref:TRAP transporter, 4TM/12TM fusion protein n=1 Tax=Pseudooceanicola nitratireducens TaxID=517719 RepID=A0A1I1M5Q0_9RHOB|nr:TRAP transporter fused permease subunit [Pseudooceanicola nitratireducens]MEC7298165.1 TRAP transporter fused permease subunit [Pseudomonadota bacterium]MEC8666675.1 TRAP transporter fused permease subunit [Pseudomonadota bacterium]SEI91058.1 TRAP transporter, 4TM/12TM fusion protein [Pseudooceanicola nitratireducens]SFC80366.1 TRAP transporter, 4TM/12TM fusion protein [Pseudooceanicola nitratireducens]